MAENTNMLDALRQHLHNLEEAVTTFNDVLMETGKQREEAWRNVMNGLVMEFGLAVFASPDMTPEQRAHWLNPQTAAVGSGQEAGEEQQDETPT